MKILDGFPIWIVFLFTVGYCVLIFEIGFRTGGRLRRRYPEAEVGGATGGVTGGLLGLLAFILAITIGIAGNMHQTRMELVAAEANAIGTAFLRTDFVEEPDQTALRDLLRKYAPLKHFSHKLGKNPIITPADNWGKFPLATMRRDYGIQQPALYPCGPLSPCIMSEPNSCTRPGC